MLVHKRKKNTKNHNCIIFTILQKKSIRKQSKKTQKETEQLTKIPKIDENQNINKSAAYCIEL
jgi:hypothetical protein